MVKHVAIIHPDLGIGGAEQLIVNIALALKLSDYHVTIYTPRHEKERSFKPTNDGTLNVQVRGSAFPSSILGKGIAGCSMVRMLLASLYVILFGGQYDYIIIDQVSAILPVFWLSSAKIIFYCHFPDQLLCTERTGAFKRAYRYILDHIEEIGLWKADLIFVNSNFTKGITLKTFRSLKENKITILYPCINLDFPTQAPPPKFLNNAPYFFSLNRFERKKNINLAIKAYSLLKDRSYKLLIGGGFDIELKENLEHFEELNALCKELGLAYCVVDDWETPLHGSDVYFAKNLTEKQREQALQNTVCVLYTPDNGKE
jgi:alpha-1,3/alpha-1,6-mannosyltransferase